MIASGARRGTWQLRVLPAAGGAWRVEDPGGVQARCATLDEAQSLAEQLAHEAGGGEVLVYDSCQRLRTVKRFPPRAASA